MNDQQIEVLKAALAASKAESEKALADKSAPPLSYCSSRTSALIPLNDVCCCADSTRNGRVPKPTRKAKEAGDVDEYEV